MEKYPLPTKLTGDGLVTSVRIIDEASPQIAATLSTLKPATTIALEAMGNSIKEGVKKSFKRAQYESADHPITLRYKSMTGGSAKTLEETGRLKQSLEDCKVEMVPSGVSRQSVRVSWEFPTSGETGLYPDSRKDNSFMYILSHEFGSTRMSKRIFFRGGMMGIEDAPGGSWTLMRRPFLIRGIQEGMQSGEAQMMTAMLPVLQMDMGGLARVKGLQPLGISIFPALLPHTMFGFGMYFVPPSALYAVAGAGADLKGILKGSFSERASFIYLRQMLWGQLGFTKKTTRRAFRGRIWGTR